MNALVPVDSGTPPADLVQLWDHDYKLIATKPDGQSIDAFVAQHVKPGECGNLTRDWGGLRWSGRVEVAVTFHQDWEHLKAIAVWKNPTLWG